MVGHLRTLGASAEVLDLIDTVYVIDQGTRHVADHPDFADSAKGLGDKLRIIEQGNIGGSGGFSRSMDETVRAGDSDYLLILDDDITLEPESILRAATFADLARKPTIVGGHMFSLYDRSVLHAFAESIAPRKWWWETSPNTKARHDFGRRNLRNTPWLHRRAEADYNGWWMCLIPTKIIKELGLAIPVFIKWDDAEYAVRAGSQGLPDGVDARGGRVAHSLAGQERRAGLAGVLPHPQPGDRGAAALAVQARRPPAGGKRRAPAAEPAVDAVLDGGAAAAGHRGRPVRARPPAPRPRHEDGQPARAAPAVHRRTRGPPTSRTSRPPGGRRRTS